MSNDNLPSKNTKKVLHGEFIGKDESLKNDENYQNVNHFYPEYCKNFFGGSLNNQNQFYEFMGNTENSIGEGNLFEDLFSNFLSLFRR